MAIERILAKNGKESQTRTIRPKTKDHTTSKARTKDTNTRVSQEIEHATNSASEHTLKIAKWQSSSYMMERHKKTGIHKQKSSTIRTREITQRKTSQPQCNSILGKILELRGRPKIGTMLSTSLICLGLPLSPPLSKPVWQTLLPTKTSGLMRCHFQGTLRNHVHYQRGTSSKRL